MTLCISRIAGINFLSFAEFDFKPEKGLTAIVGMNKDSPGSQSNGSGKSALTCDALAFALFGKTLRGIDGDAVIRLGAEADGCEVWVELEQDGHTIKIVRRRKGGKTILKLFTPTEGDVSFDRVKDVQGQIEQLLGFDFNVFTQTVVFGQGIDRFLRLSDSDKKAVIERVLNLSVFERAVEAARAAEKFCRSDGGALELRIAVEEAKKVTLERERDAMRDAAERKHIDRKTRIAALEKAIADAPTPDEFTKADAAIVETEKTRSRHETEKARCSESLKPLAAQKTSASEALDAAGREAAKLGSVANVSQAKMVSFSKTLTGVEGLVNRKCPTCFQDVAGDHVEKSMAPKLKDLEGQYIKARDAADAADAKVDAFRKDFKAAQTTFDNATASVIRLQTELRVVDLALVEAVRCRTALDRRQADIERFIEDLARLKAEGEVEAADLRGFNDKIKTVTDEMTALALKSAALRVRADDARFWVDAFGLGGIRSMLLDSVLPFVEDRANEYLMEITGGTIRVALSPVRPLKSDDRLKDTITVAIATSSAGATYESLSSGEQQRVDLALALSLFDLARLRSGADIGLVAFDELFEHLDAAGCETAVKLLQRIASRFGSVLVVSHQDALLQDVPHVVRVVKENVISRVEVA